MLGVLESNHENVLDAVHGLQEQLREIESALVTEDYGKLKQLLNAAQHNYSALIP
jgi:prephenate dehydrogenase